MMRAVRQWIHSLGHQTIPWSCTHTTYKVQIICFEVRTQGNRRRLGIRRWVNRTKIFSKGDNDKLICVIRAPFVVLWEFANDSVKRLARREFAWVGEWVIGWGQYMDEWTPPWDPLTCIFWEPPPVFVRREIVTTSVKPWFPWPPNRHLNVPFTLLP